MLMFLKANFVKIVILFLNSNWFLSWWWFLKSSLTGGTLLVTKQMICIYFHHHNPFKVWVDLNPKSLSTENHKSYFQNFRDLLCFVSFILTLADWRKFGFGFSIREELRFKETLNVQVEGYQGELKINIFNSNKT